MNSFLKLNYLILILILNASCVEKSAPPKEISKEQSIIPSNSKILKFNSGIRAMLHDSKGNYWFGSHQEGACFYDGKTVQYFTKKEGLADNQIRSITEDNNGDIWFGTPKGVSKFDGQKMKTYPFELKTPKTEWGTTTGNLWFNAGETSGINRFDGQNLNYLSFPLPKNNSKNNAYGVTGISKGKNGTIWIATYSALFKYNGKSISTFNNRKLQLKKDEELHIRSVYSDSKGRTWIGNNGIGVLLLQGDSTINFSDRHGLIHPNSSKNGDYSQEGTMEHIFAIQEDANGNIWFGDRDTGAWKYDGKTMTNYTIDSNLSSKMVWDIYVDNDKNLLFGMSASGVYQFNGKSFDKLF